MYRPRTSISSHGTVFLPPRYSILPRPNAPSVGPTLLLLLLDGCAPRRRPVPSRKKSVAGVLGPGRRDSLMLNLNCQPRKPAGQIGRFSIHAQLTVFACRSRRTTTVYGRIEVGSDDRVDGCLCATIRPMFSPTRAGGGGLVCWRVILSSPWSQRQATQYPVSCLANGQTDAL